MIERDFEPWEINPQYHIHGLELCDGVDCQDDDEV
jgi:hypothetical protein